VTTTKPFAPAERLAGCWLTATLV